ncbi:hypothetical protein [Symbiobacterium thermophilum]|uniref:Uncharacterized protein n=1 Tax=Symbiobacterium thermophilum TaxID=2734 RepID=A0A953I319_SYMTR|nr:hypothetical protein [Symbiobacterium thermophilum]MBY6276076.1 hypothetical protein [Symbiobacterium thermophilum]
MISTPTQRWIAIGLLAVALTGCSFLSKAPSEEPVAPVQEPSDPPEPSEQPTPGSGDGEGPAGDERPPDDEPAAEEVTMLDCLRRFGLSELAPGVDELIRGLPDDGMWQCVARTARFDRNYRAWVAHEVLVSGVDHIDASLPGYRAFVRTTELHFAEPQTLPVPEGWTLQDALPSPSGRYLAARLADGGVGWWAADGRAQERYDVDGYDLVWHPEEDQLAFISDGRRLHLVRPAGPAVHQVYEAPAEAPIRFPYWALETWYAGYNESYPPGTLLVLADPEGEPEGLALRPDTGRWGRFPAKRIFDPVARAVRFPSWLTQPWSTLFGEYLHLVPDGGWLAYPNPGGSPYTFYQVPDGVEPVTLTWSPNARLFALVERRDGQLIAQVLRGSHDYTGRQYAVPLENAHIAVWDDGVTVFTVTGATVRAKNHLTGTEHAWQVEGEVKAIRLGGFRLYIVLADRIIVVPFSEAASLSEAPRAEHPADAA